jgi:molybdopterin molybdotransferase
MTRMSTIESHCCATTADMIAPEAALACAMELKIGDLPITLASLLGSKGMILAADVAASMDVPPFDASAMDGYALRSSDAAESGATELPVMGQALAGDAPVNLPRGAAIRILTGAALPTGADCIVMQEDVERTDDRIRFSERPRRRQHIRLRGNDLAAGQLVLAAGLIMGPREIAAAAAAGQGSVAIRTRLPVALISTGSELRDPGAALSPGQIWNVNLPMLCALADHRWIDLLPAQNIPDTLSPLILALKEASERARLIVTSGGAAGGDADLVVEAIIAAGGQAQTLRLAMKPGKPMVLGRIGEAVVIGLPGNPVSAFVTWNIVALPLALHLAGATPLRSRPCWGTLSRPLQRAAGRREYRPARIVGHDINGRPVLDLAPKDFSARIALLASMDGLAVLTEDTSDLACGEEVTFLPFFVRP